MTEQEKKLITREKHPGRLAQGHKFIALMKKRNKDILRNKEQSTVQSTKQSLEQSSVQSTEPSTEHPSVQSTVQSNYVYNVGILAVLAIVVCVFFAYNTFQPKNKKQANEKHDQQTKLRHML